jgi:hypothetical protein
VDITVKPIQDGKAWSLIDLLGRSMGRIVEDAAEHFTIHPDGFARASMNGINDGPFPTLTPR